MRIIGSSIVGPGEANKYLEETLKEFKRLCDDVLICLCGKGNFRKEAALLRKYQFRYFYDNREWGIHQPTIKTDMLKIVMRMKGDWRIALDADETLPTLDRHLFEELTKNRESMQFYVVNLWNDEKHYRKDLGFYNVRAHKLIEGMETQFLRKPLHCGLAPPYFYCIPSKNSYVPHLLLHKGLMKKESRVQKVERYQIYDPNAVCKGQEYYDSLEQDWATGTEYDEKVVVNRITEFINNLK